MSPAFILARAGYEVWLGNARGSRHSRDHEFLDPDSNPAFWEFSFQQMAYYDLPAEIDYIRSLSNNRTIAYIGHSQGTTQAFMAFAKDKPYWKERINSFIAMAPGLVPTKPDSEYKAEKALGDNVGDTLWNLGIHEFFGKNWRNLQARILKVLPSIR